MARVAGGCAVQKSSSSRSTLEVTHEPGLYMYGRRNVRAASWDRRLAGGGKGGMVDGKVGWEGGLNEAADPWEWELLPCSLAADHTGVCVDPRPIDTDEAPVLGVGVTGDGLVAMLLQIHSALGV